MGEGRGGKERGGKAVSVSGTGEDGCGSVSLMTV